MGNCSSFVSLFLGVFAFLILWCRVGLRWVLECCCGFVLHTNTITSSFLCAYSRYGCQMIDYKKTDIMSLRWDSNLSWMSTILFEMAFQHDGFGSLISFLFVLYVDALRSSEKKEGKNNSDDTSFQAIMTTTPSIFSRGGGWMCNQYNFNIPRVIFSFPSHNIALPLSSLQLGCSQYLATLSILVWSYSRVVYKQRVDTGEMQR